MKLFLLLLLIAVGYSLNCHYSCKLDQCVIQANSSSCTDCDTTRVLSIVSGSEGKCLCQSKKYDDGSSNLCQSCDISCQTCDTANECLTCPPTSHRTLDTTDKTCPCDENWYSTGVETCAACDYTCKTCLGLSANCTDCDSTYLRSKIASGSDHSCPCNLGYYDKSVQTATPQTKMCAQCSYKCLTCSGTSTTCDSCDPSKNRDSTSACACLNTYYDDGTSLCKKCKHSCATCTTATSCVTCPTPATSFRTLASNQCICNNGYYDDGASSNCVKCHYSCLTCTNSSSCATCDESTNKRILNSSSTYCSCIAKYYDASILPGTEAPTCLACHATCLYCITSNAFDKCIQCNNTAFRTANFAAGGTGNCLCKTGYYQTSASVQLCSACSIKCLTCSSSATVCDSCRLNSHRENTACSCKDGYYENNTQTCGTCSNKCKTCLNPNSCATCQTSGTNRQNDAANMCPCVATFYDTGAKVCVSCLDACATCSNPSNCDTCKSGFILQNGQCVCPIRKFLSTPTTCVDCDPTCLTCTNGGDNQCLTCNPSSYRQFNSLNNKCECMSGYVQTASVQLCVKCHFSCQTCSGFLSSNCDSCNGSNYRYNNGGICDCMTRYYSDGINQACLPCHHSCKTCLSASICIDCDNSITINRQSSLNASSLCSCQALFYDDGVNQACVPCSKNCTTCLDSSTCVTCNEPTNFRILFNSTCICKQGYYDVGAAICSKCPISCRNCTAAGCTSCIQTNYRSLVGTLCSCMTGYFQASPVVEACSVCSPKCLTCNLLSTTCTSCDPSTYRNLSSNACVCGIGYYDDNTAICSKCHYSCRECSAYSTCSSCDSSKGRSQVGSTCVCNTSAYDDGVNQQCVKCSYKCKTCDATGCLTCDDANTFRQLSAKICVCKAKYYDDGSSLICNSCPYSCASCTNGSACSSCDSATNHRELNNSTSLCTCIAKYFDNAGSSSRQICQDCDYSCYTCSADLATNCLSCRSSSNRVLTSSAQCLCKNGYFDSSVENCSICDYTCATCTGTAAACSTCNGSNFRIKHATNPQCDCIAGYFHNNTAVCAKCHYSCITCTSYQVCTSCDPATRDHDSSNNVCNCKAQKYDNGITAACSPCLSTCLSCSNGNNCTTCDTPVPSTFRILMNGACNCLDKYFDNAGTCQSCNITCKTCKNSDNNCLTCNVDANRILKSGSPNQCVCKQGYYDDLPNQNCVKCHRSCKTCSGAGACDSSGCSTQAHRTYQGPLCICLDGYYDDGVNQVCGTCHHSCQKCTNNLACSDCDTAKFRDSVDTNTGHCLCLTDYYDDGIGQQCQRCPYRCGSCTNSTSCATCDESTDFRIPSGNTCICKDGYFEVANNPVCQKCDYTCLTCTAAGSCLTCNTSDGRILDTTCKCITGFYDVGGSNPTCAACKTQCLTCNDATTCSSCPAASNGRQSDGNNLCPCKNGYFQKNVQNCGACDYSCKTCTVQTTCSSCDSTTSFRTGGPGGLCVCMDYYYNNGTNQICLPCHYSCLTCSNSSSSKCLSCPIASFRTLTSGSCPCDQYYFDTINVKTCTKCDYSCASCAFSVANCTTCNSAKYRYLQTSSSTCKCMSGYYNVLNIEQCQPCLTQCTTCTAAISCSTCNETNFRVLSSSLCPCKDGYYELAPNIQLCSPCHYSCKTCLNSAACLTCDEPLNHRNPNPAGYCTCKDGFYEVIGNPVCQACDYTCQTCTNNSKCTGCDVITSKRQFNNVDKTCLCVQGYFDTNVNVMQCSPCSYTCLTCKNSANNCTTCSSANFRSIISGPSGSCPCIQYYYDKSDPIAPSQIAMCERCHYTCSNCTKATQCVSCNISKFRIYDSGAKACNCMNGYFDNNVEECSKCDHSCWTCTQLSKCVDCNTAVSFRTLDTGGTDLCLCNTGFYESGNFICSSCLYHCQKCSNGTSCNTCDGTKNRVINTSTKLCDCKQYFFDSGLNSTTCLDCHYSCDSCTNNTQCATCSSVDHRFYNTTTKLCQCSLKYFNSGTNRVCVACHYSCTTCSQTTINDCLSCDATKFRVLDTGKCACKKGYFDDGNETCKACDYSCYECAGTAQTCTACNSTYNRVSPPVSDNCPCLDHFYDDLQNMNCPSCQHSCLTCTNSTACSTCDTTKKRLATPSTFCLCEPKYYDDGVQQLCQPCSYKCNTCQGTSTNCTSCDTPNNFRKNIPACNCLDKYFDNTAAAGTSTPICVLCHYSCSKCVSSSGPTQCTSCNSTKFRTYQAGSCLCRSGYFDDNSNEQCVPCSHSCLTCTSLTDCLTCNTTNHRTKPALSSTCPCDQHYFDNGVSMCASCHYSCSSCSTSNIICDTCDISKHRNIENTNHLCICNDGFYDNGTSSQLCSPCHSSCKTCTDATRCQTCVQTNNRVLNNSANLFGVSSNYCVCFYGYYPDVLNVVCSPCHYSCEVCSGGSNTNCQKCGTAYKRYLVSGQCKCNDGYYDDGTNPMCQQCESQCTKCTAAGNNNCQACASPYFYTASASTCNSSCGSYTWTDTPNRICRPCTSNCPTCSSSNYCTSCDASYNFLTLGSSKTCVSPCPDLYYPSGGNCNLCSSVMPNCIKCPSNSVCTTCDVGYGLKNPADGCLKCNSNCKTCSVSATTCTDCYYPLVLHGDNTCKSVTCSSNQYPHSILNCRNCILDYPNSLTCNNVSPLTCDPNYFVYIKDKVCTDCASRLGFININGQCQETCGDGNNYNMECDDGNTINGDGCSPTCTIETGWQCSSSGPTSKSDCTPANPLKITLESSRKVPGSNQIIVIISTSVAVRLNTANTNVVLSNNALESYTITMLTLTSYQINVYYKASIQSTSLSIYVNINGASRLLYQHSRLLQGASFDFHLDIDTYPPANYYDASVTNTYNGISIFLHIVCAITLAFAVLGFLGFKRIVFYSVQLFNMLVLLYILEGMGLVSYSDWIAYSIPTMKSYTLIGGFSIGVCKCYASLYQYQYGYCDQLFENAGVVMAIDAGILLLLGIFLSMYKIKIKDQKQKKQIGSIDKLYIYGRYYVLAFLLVFNSNVAFSSFLSLYTASTSTTVGVVNIIFACIVVAFTVTFFVGFFFWTRQLSVPIIYPEPKEKQIQNVHDKSSAVLSANHSRRGSSFRQDSKQESKSNPPEKDSYFDGSEDQEQKKSQQSNIFEQPEVKKPNPGVQISSIQLQAAAGERIKTGQHQQEVVLDELLHPKYQRMLMFDFVDLFNDDSWARYYTFIYSILVTCTLVFVAFLQQYPIPKFAVLIALHGIFLIYVVLKRPFKGKFDNFKSIVVQCIFLAILACDMAIIANPSYTYGLELAIMIALCLVLVANVCFYVVQVIYAYSQELSDYFGIKKPQVNKVPDDTPKIQENYDNQVQKVQMDAFFERVLKKNKINKQYRKERRLKARD